MGAITLNHATAMSQLIDIVQNLLPAHSISCCAGKAHFGMFWKKGKNKRESIRQLLRYVFEITPDKFHVLVEEILREAIIYKYSLVDRKMIVAIIAIMKELECDTSELDKLLKHLSTGVPKQGNKKKPGLADLKKEYEKLDTLSPHQGGYSYQDFLFKLLTFSGLQPKKPFRNTGEEIDGSFKLCAVTYLFEAKRQNTKSNLGELRVFQVKVQTKSQGTRGIFFSNAGYTEQALKAIGAGQQICIIGFDSMDIELILEGKISLIDAIEEKWRAASESGRFFVSMSEILKRK